MRKRILPWLLAISMTVGSLVPSVPAFAAENEQEITDSSPEDYVPEDDSVTTNLQDEDSAGTGDTVIEEPDPEAEVDPAKTDVPEDAAGESGTKEEIDEETGSEQAEAEKTAPEQTEETEETDEVLLQEDPEAVPSAAAKEEAQEVLLSDEITSDTAILKLRSVDLMYGESADNTDGHLDRLFAPVVTDGDTAYKLKTAESSEDSPTFTTSYKFITDSSAFDIENEAFTELTDAEKVETFKGIEEANLAMADAGSRLFVVAMAITSDGKAAYDVSEFTVSKRPVAIEFPATEELSVSADALPEDGLITVAADSELFSDVAVIPAYEYTISEADTEKTVKGTEADRIAVPDAAAFIPAGVTVDVTGLDLTVPGYQPADAAYELNSELFDNYTVTVQDTWPVYVVASQELVSAQLMDATPIDGKVPTLPKDPDIQKNEVGFISTSSGELAIAVKSTHLHTNVELYISTNPKRTGAIIFDNITVDAPYASYVGSNDESRERSYLMANAHTVDTAMFVTGTYYIFGRFYTGEGKKGYVESVNTITVDAFSGKAPKILEIVNATSATAEDGSVTIENPENSRNYININRYGSGEYVAKVLPEYSKFVVNNLAPGHYLATFQGYDVLFADSIDFGPTPAEFYIGEETATPVELSLYNRSTGEPLASVTLKKGETLSVAAVTQMSNSNTIRDSAEVIFQSSDPKSVSVDAIGNVKALKADAEVTITATTVAKNKDGDALSNSITVKTTNDPLLKIKTAKFDKSTYDFNLTGASDEKNLEILLDSGIDCPVTWYSNNYGVVSDHAAEYKTKADGSGKAVLKVYINKPGKAVITANVGGVKTISCTINVSGYSSTYGPYFYGGKYLTGFWGFRRDSESDSYVPVASGFGSLKKGAEVIRYYDPYTYLPAAKGVINVKNKLYLVQADGFIAIGGTKKSMFADDDGLYYVINTSGEIQTGWQKPDLHDTEFYFDPGTGARAKETWVPKGKGYTWVNKDGLMLDDNDNPLSNNGVHEVKGFNYCFKEGLLQTGLVYFDKSGAIINAKDVAKKPQGSCYALYFSPANGRLFIPSGTGTKDMIIGIGGKKYFVLTDGTIFLGCRLAYTDKDLNYYHSDYTGALFVNQLFTFNGKTYYADAEGILAKDKCVTIGGRVYHFNNNCEMDCIDEGVRSELYYNDENGIFRPVYVKASNSKKPAAGTFFYKDPECKQKITNNTLSEKAGDSYLSVYYVSKQGSLFSGLLKIGSSTYFFDPDTYRISTADYDHFVTYKGKKYLCNKYGVVIISVSEITVFKLDQYRTGYITTDKNGVLLTGLQTIQKKKYLFDTDGVLKVPGYNGLLSTDEPGKRYFANPEYDSNDPYTWYVYAPGKFMVHVQDSSTSYIIAKDGTVVQSGWATVDGAKYYVFDGEAVKKRDLWKIGGKYYHFDESGIMVTGWQRMSSLEVMDVASHTSLGDYNGEYYFYFNQKNGALVTGWQNMPAPVTSGGNIVWDMGISSGAKKKLYFNTANTGDLPIGALVTNRDMTVGGKLYRFDADGSVKTGQEGMVYSDPASGTYTELDSYLKADGTMARGRTLVKLANTNTYFYFNLDDGKKATSVLRKTGKSWFYYGRNGEQSMNVSMIEPLPFTRKTVFALFNKDGSINSFVRKDGNNEKLKNCWIQDEISGEVYFLGNDGLPKTGIATENISGYKIYTEADGRPGGKLNPSSSDYKLVKSGNKFYLTRDGVIVDHNSALSRLENIGPDGLIRVAASREMFDGLPASDQTAIDKMYEYHDTCYKRSLPMILVLNQDGSVHSGKVNADGVSATSNKYGLLNEAISAFVNNGGWKLSPAKRESVGGKSEFVIECVDLKKASTAAGGESTWYTDIKINLDINNNITVTDLSGKTLTGDYVFVTSNDFGFFAISVKNGKLSTGKKTYNVMGFKLTFEFDKTYGIALVPDGGK